MYEKNRLVIKAPCQQGELWSIKELFFYNKMHSFGWRLLFQNHHGKNDHIGLLKYAKKQKWTIFKQSVLR